MYDTSTLFVQYMYVLVLYNISIGAIHVHTSSGYS